MGTRFPGEPGGPGAGNDRQYEATLYRGASGVGLALLDLPALDARPEIVGLLDRVSAGLTASTPLRGPLRPGLYDGHAGIALFHFTRAHRLRNRAALDQAMALGTRLSAIQPALTDLIGGAAGLGLALLTLHHGTGDPAYRRGARRAARFLEDTAVPDRRGLASPIRDPRELSSDDEPVSDEERELQPGLAHGVAGVCVFLCALAAAAPDRRTTRLLDGAFRWLDAQALDRAGALDWPRSTQRPRRLRAHWCHGATGIARLPRPLSLTGEQQALATAARAGLSAWRWARAHPRELACHCHGLAGAAELTLDLSSHGAGPVWRIRADTWAGG